MRHLPPRASRAAVATLGALAMLAGGAAGCAEAEHRVEYESYAGPPAYPNRRPRLPAPKGAFAFVSDRGSDSLTVLDLPSHELVGSFPIGRDPVGTDGPGPIAIDASGALYVLLISPAPSPLPGPHALHAPAARPAFVQKLAADDLRVLGQVEVAPDPVELVLSPDETRIIVTHFDLSRALDTALTPEERASPLTVLDTAALAGTAVSPARKACRASRGAAFAADGRHVVIACYAEDALVVADSIDPTAPRTTVSIGCAGPSTVVASPSRARLFVGCDGSKQVRFVDGVAGAPVGEAIATKGVPHTPAWSADEARVWVPTQSPDALVAIDVAAGTLVVERAFDAETCLRPRQAVLAGDGATLYVVCEGSHTEPGHVLAVDPKTLATRATLATGVFPDRLAIKGGP